jgi:hypothetical protein
MADEARYWSCIGLELASAALARRMLRGGKDLAIFSTSSMEMRLYWLPADPW